MVASLQLTTPAATSHPISFTNNNVMHATVNLIIIIIIIIDYFYSSLNKYSLEPFKLQTVQLIFIAGCNYFV